MNTIWLFLRFGLEFDLRQIDRDNPGFIYTEYFHTMMYLNFATYLRTNSKNNALKAIAELMSDGYKLRVAAHYKNMEDIIELTPAGWGFFNKGQYVAHAEATIVNQGPYIISQRLYQLIFGKKNGINKPMNYVDQKDTNHLNPMF